MKHTLKSFFLAASAIAVPAQADTVLGLYVGAQGWNMDTEGGFSNDADLTTFDSFAYKGHHMSVLEFKVRERLH